MFLSLLSFSRVYVHTGRSIKSVCHALGLRHPAQVTDMYLRGESAEYISAAIHCVNQSGE